MTDQYFKNFNNLPPLPQHVIDEGLNAEYEFVFGPPMNVRFRGETMRETKFFKLLEKEFTDVKTSFLKNPPMSYYGWHQDFARYSALNWELKTNPKSGAYYRLLDPPEQHKELFYKLYPVDYTPNHLTLLNVKEDHCIINDSTEDRIVLTVGMYNPRATYQTVKEFLESLDTIEW